MTDLEKSLSDCAGTHDNDADSPDGKSPRCRGNIGLLAPVVCTIPSRRETEDIRPQEEEIHNDIDDLPSRSERTLNVVASARTFKNMPSFQL